MGFMGKFVALFRAARCVFGLGVGVVGRSQRSSSGLVPREKSVCYATVLEIGPFFSDLMANYRSFTVPSCGLEGW